MLRIEEKEMEMSLPTKVDWLALADKVGTA